MNVIMKNRPVRKFSSIIHIFMPIGRYVKRCYISYDAIVLDNLFLVVLWLLLFYIKLNMCIYLPAYVPLYLPMYICPARSLSSGRRSLLEIGRLGAT